MTMTFKLLASVAVLSVTTALSACAQDSGSEGTDERASAYYDDGCNAGREDRKAGLSMAYERHAGEYDTEAEGSFQAGYEKCWSEG